VRHYLIGQNEVPYSDCQGRRCQHGEELEERNSDRFQHHDLVILGESRQCQQRGQQHRKRQTLHHNFGNPQGRIPEERQNGIVATDHLIASGHHIEDLEQHHEGQQQQAEARDESTREIARAGDHVRALCRQRPTQRRTAASTC
jgi:hypothetical protein